MGSDGLAGPQGEPGPAGPQGPQGPSGQAGGAIGPEGPQGAEGSQGEPGAQGDTGAAGPQGVQGQQGAVGAQGLTGALGPAGTQGPAGAQGTAGAEGAAGAQGAAGPRGAIGSSYGEEAASFVGFTSAVYPGGIGSRTAMHAACRAEYADAHLCHVSEYSLSNSATTVPEAGAWVDRSCGQSGLEVEVTASGAHARIGRYVDGNGNCANWVGDEFGMGLTINREGPRSQACELELPLACCNTDFLEEFAGFTTATVTGNMGGRAAAHGVCSAELPGSHMCHGSEYYRGVSDVSPPAEGAWIDRSMVLRSSTRNISVTQACATVDFGRYIAGNGNCSNWTSDVSTSNGAAVRPAGNGYGQCSSAQPVACCY